MKVSIYVVALFIVAGFTPLAVEANQVGSTTTQTVEDTVREYFADIPVMIEVARCESQFRQFADSGNVLRGGMGGQMIGVYQFFDRYHITPAAALGFDIETLEGNLAYARYIYKQEGTTPWAGAQSCWDAPVVSAVLDVDESKTVLRQKIALLEQIISLLQTLLIVRQGSV